MNSGLHRALLPLLLSAAFFLFSCSGEEVSPGTAEVQRTQVRGVSVATVAPMLVDEYYETSGTVKAKNVSTVASKLMGVVTSLRVREGERVRAGQVLLTIESGEVEQRVKAAGAAYQEAQKSLEVAAQHKALARTTFDRYKVLFDEKALSRQELDQIETQKRVAAAEYERAQESVSRAKALLSEAQVQRGFATITASRAGVVSEKKIDTGSMAVPGMPLLVIEDTSAFELEAPLDESLSGTIKDGMRVQIGIDALGQTLEGKITEVVPSINPLSRTFIAKIGLADPHLRSGLYARVRIPTGRKEKILVPEDAVVHKGQLTGVYVVDSSNVVTYRLVRTGAHYDKNIEILSGISGGERIITAGASKAVDGGILTGVEKK